MESQFSVQEGEVVRKPEPGANEELAPNPVKFPTIVCSRPASPAGWRVSGEPRASGRGVMQSLVTSLENDVTG